MKVIFQDEDLMVIDKEAGLVVDRSNTQTEDTLEDILRKEFQIKIERGGIVHRLDKDTSGILLVAKTQDALENLQAQFKMRKTKKEYLALVHGLVEKAGVVEGAITRNPLKREKFIVNLQGDALEARSAMTEYEPTGNFQFSPASWRTIFNDLNKIQMRKLERMNYNQFTLLACHPLTGRTHQIRVHLKYISHPIVSDEKYAGRKVYRLDKRWCPRMFLHAKRLGFYHPRSGEWMEMESELPKDLIHVLRLLRRFTPRNDKESL